MENNHSNQENLENEQIENETRDIIEAEQEEQLSQSQVKEENTSLLDSESPTETDCEPGSRSSKVLKEIFSWIKVIVAAIVLSLFLNKFVFFTFTVPTESMENTIMVDNRIFSLRCAYWFSDPKRCDIVVFPYPDNPEETFIKRVIGLPGETVEGKDGYVYINGERLEEDYVTSDLDEDFGPIEIPDDSYFVLGDNRDISLDARYWENKFVSRKDIISKAVLRFYPSIGVLK